MLRDALIKICKEYQAQKNKTNWDFVKELRNDVTSFFSNNLKDLLTNIKVKTVQGIGNMTAIAWISFLDKDVTTTTQKGYYPAYLFCEDSKQFELVLTQGTYMLIDQDVKKIKGEIINSILKTRALILRGKLTNNNNNYFDEKISKKLTFLKNDTDRRRWQLASAFGKIYHIDNLPSEEELIKDLKKMIELYKLAIQKGGTAQEGETYDEEYESFSGDEKVKLQKHKEDERKILQVNTKLINDLKENYKYTCQACGLTLKDIYGDYFGEKKEFIEAHHIIPKSETLKNLKDNEKLKRTKEDFAILCANCHRIIHRYNTKLKKFLTLEEFKEKINK